MLLNRLIDYVDVVHGTSVTTVPAASIQLRYFLVFYDFLFITISKLLHVSFKFSLQLTVLQLTVLQFCSILLATKKGR